ncbi:MAG: Cob(I)yrinic acid a,c-diamide adenosyltransferase [Bacteroidota bacterium]|jgi:cob(I)alamin adenosyltransferase
MKIYTKNGDKGFTTLADGQGVSKSESRIQALGEIDELNCYIGLVISKIPADKASKLQELQSTLFTLGAHISTDSPEILGNMKLLSLHDIVLIEEMIDEIDGQISPLTNFILPGGNETIAQVQIARAVCRRAERTLIHWVLSENKENYQIAIAFLNRLSDYLFMLSRYLHQEFSIPEITWKSGK